MDQMGQADHTNRAQAYHVVAVYIRYSPATLDALAIHASYEWSVALRSQQATAVVGLHVSA